MNGVNCERIQAPNAKCSRGLPLETLAFSIDLTTDCEGSRNRQFGQSMCTDYEKYRSGDVRIVCRSLDNNPLKVEPSVLQQGSHFTITASSNELPEKVECTIYDEFDQILQTNIIDTSGSVSLHLKEKYGFLEVEACDEQSCIQKLELEFLIENMGKHDVTISDILVTYGSKDTLNLGDKAGVVSPGETTTVDEALFFDICSRGSLSVDVEVRADQDDGPSCSREDNLEFAVEPKCDIGASLACFEKENGEPCEELISVAPTQCICQNSCPESLSFKYTGEDCSDSDSSDSGSMSECDDILPFKPQKGLLLVRDATGSIFFEAEAEKGSTVEISDDSKACMPDDFEVSIVSPDSRATVYQTLTFSKTCNEDGAMVTDPFGALEFAGYSCSDGVDDGCFVDVVFETCVANEGSVPLIIKEAKLKVGDVGNEVDTSSFDGEIESGEMFCSEVVQSISLCGVETIEASLEVEADDDSGIGCLDETGFSISLHPAPTASPTTFPTEGIVIRVPPTSAPTENIVTVPPPVYIPPPPPPPPKKIIHKGKGKGKRDDSDHNVGFCKASALTPCPSFVQEKARVKEKGDTRRAKERVDTQRVKDRAATRREKARVDMRRGKAKVDTQKAKAILGEDTRKAGPKVTLRRARETRRGALERAEFGNQWVSRREPLHLPSIGVLFLVHATDTKPFLGCSQETFSL